MCETDVSIESMSIADSHRRCILTITLWAPQCTAVCSVGGNIERCKIHFKGVHVVCVCCRPKEFLRVVRIASEFIEEANICCVKQNNEKV